MGSTGLLEVKQWFQCFEQTPKASRGNGLFWGCWILGLRQSLVYQMLSDRFGTDKALTWDFVLELLEIVRPERKE